jgi:hypothetical protein
MTENRLDMRGSELFSHCKHTLHCEQVRWLRCECAWPSVAMSSAGQGLFEALVM